MERLYRVIAPKEGKRLSKDFTDLEAAADFARRKKLRPLSVVRVFNKGTSDERYEIVVQFT